MSTAIQRAQTVPLRLKQEQISRQTEPNGTSLKAIHLTMSYLDPNGKVLYKTMPLYRYGLKENALERLVQQIEDQWNCPIE